MVLFQTNTAAMIPIDDPDDPRIAPYRDVRDRDRAGRHDAFLAEGDVIVRVLLSGRSRFRARSILVSSERARARGDWLGSLDHDLPVYVAGREVMDAIVGFPIHRGLLAEGARTPDRDLPSILPRPGEAGVVLGLVGMANHDNVGSTFRNAAAFGAAGILLDGSSCDPLYRKSIRVSAGAVLTTPFHRGGTADAMVSTLADADLDIVALSPAGRVRLEDVAWRPRTAILVGSEGHGLPPALLDRLRSVRIEMADGFDSLNVAAATAIALHAACRRAGRGGGRSD